MAVPKSSNSSELRCPICRSETIVNPSVPCDLVSYHLDSLAGTVTATIQTCRHIFCDNCLKMWHDLHNSCPVCQQTFQERYDIEDFRFSKQLEMTRTATKIEMVFTKKATEPKLKEIEELAQYYIDNHDLPTAISLIMKVNFLDHIFIDLCSNPEYFNQIQEIITRKPDSDSKSYFLLLMSQCCKEDDARKQDLFFMAIRNPEDLQIV